MKDELLKVAQECLSDNDIKEIVRNKFKEMIEKSIEDSFRWGDVKNTLNKRLKEVLVPYIEGYDFEEYLPKLDTVLTELLNSSGCKAERDILNNFKELVKVDDRKEITVSEIFEEYVKYCDDAIKNDISYSPTNETVECRMDIEYIDKNIISNFQDAVINLSCEYEDVEDLNMEIRLYKYKEYEYKIENQRELMLNSLRYLDKFNLLLLKLKRNNVDIMIDKEILYDDILLADE